MPLTTRAGGRAPRQRNILAVTDKKETKDESVELQQRVAELEKQLKQVTQSGAHSAPNSSGNQCIVKSSVCSNTIYIPLLLSHAIINNSVHKIYSLHSVIVYN